MSETLNDMVHKYEEEQNGNSAQVVKEETKKTKLESVTLSQAKAYSVILVVGIAGIVMAGSNAKLISTEESINIFTTSMISIFVVLAVCGIAASVSLIKLMVFLKQQD